MVCMDIVLIAVVKIPPFSFQVRLFATHFLKYLERRHRRTSPAAPRNIDKKFSIFIHLDPIESSGHLAASCRGYGRISRCAHLYDAVCRRSRLVCHSHHLVSVEGKSARSHGIEFNTPTRINSQYIIARLLNVYVGSPVAGLVSKVYSTTKVG